MTDNTFDELIDIIDRYSKSDGIHATAVNGLYCYKMSELNIRLPVIYRPSIYVVMQGNKQVLLGNDIFQYRQGEYLAVAVDLPLIGEVTKASKQKPYLCVQIDIDTQLMTELAMKFDANTQKQYEASKGIFVGNTDSKLMDAITRLMRLLDSPEDIPYLSTILLQEIYYRLLNSSHGGSIIQTYLRDNNMQRIAEVIAAMKRDMATPMCIDTLAKSANMSTSNFYSQFKKVTGFSPLQYLKRIRLTEARQIMYLDNKDASSTSYMVGYESPSQFNREYARLFGAPPQRDIKKLKQQVHVN